MEVKIFGCKVNKYYTDKWLNDESLKDKSGVFIATCVVTDKAKRKWVKFVKDSVKKIGKDEKIYITGCGAFKDGKAQDDFFELYSELREFKNLIKLLDEDVKPLPNPPLSGEEKIPHPNPLLRGEGVRNLFTKKFVLVQGGCDSFCSFCLTVLKRGRHFFRSKEDILGEILEFEKNGGKEIVLTGINLGAWGLGSTNDIGKSRLGELLEYILENSKIGRIRISSLGPEFVDEKCLEVFKETRIYPHFHFSVQSGSSKILEKMRRHYDGKYIKDLLLKTKNIIRKDNVSVSIGADIIIGFPGETEDDFFDTYNLIKEVGIQKVHVFPFSPHKYGESIPAGFFPDQVDEKTKNDRVKKIIELSEKIRNDFILSQKGKTLEVLIESVRNGNWKGWTENYIEANNENFEIMNGIVKRNEVIKGKFK